MDKNIMQEIAKMIIVAKGRNNKFFVKDCDNNLKMNECLIKNINEHITIQVEKAKNNYSYYTGIEKEKVDVWELMDSSLGIEGWEKYDNAQRKNVFKFDPPMPTNGTMFNFSKECVSRESQWDFSDNESKKTEETKKDDYTIINNKED